MELARLLSRIDLVTRAWPGRGEPGMRVINAEAPGMAVFWIFNAVDELPALTPHLPADRPFVGMRSLNQITSPDLRDGTAAQDLLADHYAARLIARFGRRPCIIGGNCQAAEIAWRIAERLVLAGVDLRLFLTVDAPWFLPLPVPLRMIFGKDSVFNPASPPRPRRLARMEHCWSHAFPAFERCEIAGGHGQYFEAGHVAALAAQILRPAPASARVAAVPRPLGWRTRVGPHGGRLLVPEPGIARADDYLLLPLRRRPGESLRRQAEIFREALGPLATDDRLAFRVRKAAAPERGALLPVLCRRGHGPVAWPLDAQPEFPVAKDPDLLGGGPGGSR